MNTMKTFKDQPYLAILVFCFFAVVIIAVIENLHTLYSVAGGALVWAITTMIPILLLVGTIKLVSSVKSSRKK